MSWFRSRDSSQRVVRRHTTNVLLATTLCLTAVCVVQQATVLFAADWQSSVSRHRLSKWAEQQLPYTEADWNEVREDLEEALALTPKDATLLDAMAQLYALKGQTEWTTGEPDSPEVASYRKAMEYQQASVNLRPTHAMAWATLALTHYAVNDPPEQLLSAWREAARLAPKELAVEDTLAFIAKQSWPVMPADTREWIETRRPGFAAELAKQQATRGS